MKKLLSLLCAVLMAATMVVPAFAVEVIGQVLSTDIRAYINGAEIPAYNIDGKLAIVVSDLNNYGFKTVYNNNTRRSSVTRNYSASGNFTSVPSKASGLPIGTRVMDVYKSDITVDLDGRVVPAVNVENRMAIFFSDLQGYGSYVYDNNTRTSKIVLSGSSSTGTGTINHVEKLKLVKSPANYQLKSISEKVAFTVQISGGTAPYTYKWFIEKDNGTSNQSATLQKTSSTFNVPFSDSSFNNTKTIRIYAEVTDSTGAKVTSGKATVSPVAQTTPALKKEPEPQNGTVFLGSQLSRESELKITTGSKSAYIKLKDKNKNDVFAFYVRKNTTYTISVPAMELYLYFAVGEDWYGSTDLFGSSTVYYRDSSITDFENYTWEYDLKQTYDGNFAPSYVSENDF